VVVVTTPNLALRLRVLASPKFTNLVLSSAYLAQGTVIAIVPRGLAAGYAGNVEVETSNAAAIHFDTAPLPISTTGSPSTVAAPVESAFQQRLIILKIRARCAWCVQPGAVAGRGSRLVSNMTEEEALRIARERLPDEPWEDALERWARSMPKLDFATICSRRSRR
jgi:hypothetical protein